MAITVAEGACLGDEKMFPPGFRFHPTDEELVLYYLKKKICRRRIILDVIAEIDVYKRDPEDLPGSSKLKTGDRQWFFFSPIARKYPNGARTNRANKHGYWKLTGKDRNIKYNSRPVGVKKTLVFYRGRAPSGERTDWVMHEYTLNDEELKRCPAELDYFALYKVFKKSGPGPKNGEQYGAPFNEEDWAHDNGFGLNGLFDQVSAAKRGNEVAPAENTMVRGPVERLSSDLEEFLNQIAAEDALVAPIAADYVNALEEFIVEEKPTADLMENSSREVNVVEQNPILQPQFQQCSAQASFDVTRFEAPEVTSAINSQHHAVEEDFIEDFLEVDDLAGPQPSVQDFDKPGKVPENLQFDGLNEINLFLDEGIFLNETGQDEEGQIPPAHVSSLELASGSSDQISYHLDSGTSEQVHVSHPGPYHRENEMLDISPPPHFYNLENDMVSDQQSLVNDPDPFREVWGHDQRFVLSPSEAKQVAIPSLSPGVVYDDCIYVNHPTGSNRHQNYEQDNGTDSSFSAALWAFVESIPTTPASAAESAIVGKVFERMSSFSRVRKTCRNKNVAAGNPYATTKSSKKIPEGTYLYFSSRHIVCFFMDCSTNFWWSPQ